MTLPASAEPSSATTADESVEQRLWHAVLHDRCATSRERLFDLHLPYATALAGQLYRSRRHDDVEFRDYLQFACIGLLEAIDRFDVARSTGFRTFATRRIQGNVLDGVVRLSDGQEQVALRAKIRKERLESLNEPGGTRTMDAFQALAGLTMGLAIGFVLDETGMIDRSSSVAPGNHDHAYRTLAWRQTKTRLNDAIADLPDRERKIVQHHYFHGLTFDQIGDILDLTKGRVSQMHRAALAKLRNNVGTIENLYLKT
ncbi:sigma-70 family RNA polymerase sigma factor [Burkholderia sp. BCC1977]|uniref:sigma-70 family RNA polymerase sigma factor n=1 Tax=Burkholderia sp. BCC1977 TaxID=2817440 RepID=UPI002ABE26FC|nr:sigma-70 family RNA polymerase sigma factor [Burkholderia sp. BCC1977]